MHFKSNSAMQRSHTRIKYVCIHVCKYIVQAYLNLCHQNSIVLGLFAAHMWSNWVVWFFWWFCCVCFQKDNLLLLLIKSWKFSVVLYSGVVLNKLIFWGRKKLNSLLACLINLPAYKRVLCSQCPFIVQAVGDALCFQLNNLQTFLFTFSLDLLQCLSMSYLKKQTKKKTTHFAPLWFWSLHE